MEALTELIVNKSRCKGCGYCVANCPRKALSLGKQINEAGYTYVVCDHEKCICCGICYTVCPDYVFTIVEKAGEGNG